MKRFIKKRLKESLLNERLMDVDYDVDLIYSRFFKQDIDEIQQTGIITKDMFNTGELNTSDLSSPVSMKGHKLNPCRIIMNHYKTNFYSTSNNLISCSINMGAVNYVMSNFNGDIKRAVADFKSDGDIEQGDSLLAEFTESKTKGSIHHELAHWLDDTLHNQHIKGRGELSKKTGVMTKKGLPINADKMEIQGQIHNIVQLKKEYIKRWDEISFEELITLSTTLNVINSQLKGDIRTKWLRDLKTRMYREGLLGKNMYNN